MTYDKEYGTSASYYEKPRRTQFLEGPNEPAVGDYCEMKPRVLDFQFQAIELVFKRADGKVIRKYPDIAVEYDDNHVRFGEIKTDDTWFAAPGIRRPLESVDKALISAGLGPLLRIKGAPFRRELPLEALNLAMDARMTRFQPEEAAAARTVVLAGGGSAPYPKVVDAIGGSRAVAEGKLYAMLLRRIVDFDLAAAPTSVTAVILPRPAQAFALREVLNQFRKKAA